MHPVLEQEGRELRQRRQMVMRVDGVVQGVAQERAEIVREAVGIDALALDQAGIAEGCLLARARASTSSTERPRFCRCTATDTPTIPAPRYNDILSHEDPAPFLTALATESRERIGPLPRRFFSADPAGSSTSFRPKDASSARSRRRADPFRCDGRCPCRRGAMLPARHDTPPAHRTVHPVGRFRQARRGGPRHRRRRRATGSIST